VRFAAKKIGTVFVDFLPIALANSCMIKNKWFIFAFNHAIKDWYYYVFPQDWQQSYRPDELRGVVKIKRKENNGK
jgi:hypothetical protein